MTRRRQWWHNFLFSLGPGYMRTRPEGSVRVVMPSFEELCTSWDIDHYKRLALRAKLRQIGVLRPSTLNLRKWRAQVRGLGGSSWDSHGVLAAEQRRMMQNWHVYAKYERRVLPSPFVLAMREEMRAFVVDLSQFENWRLLRDGRDPVRRPSLWARVRAWWWHVAKL